MINLILLTISIIIFGAYVDFIWGKYGIQKSISISIYCLPEKYRFIFTLVIFGFTIPIIIASRDMVFMPIAGWLVSGVGAACYILKSKVTKAVHMFGAIVGIALACFSMWYEYGYWYIVLGIAAFIVLAYKLDKTNSIWWTEIIAFIGLILGILLKYI